MKINNFFINLKTLNGFFKNLKNNLEIDNVFDLLNFLMLDLLLILKKFIKFHINYKIFFL